MSATLHFIHHGLIDFHSHYYGEARAWTDACRGRGIAHRFYIHRRALPAIIEEFTAQPIFPITPDALVERNESYRQLADFLMLGEHFGEACKALTAVGPEDIVVVTFATERDLYGASLWLKTLPAEARPRIAFIFHGPDFEWQVDAQRHGVTGDFSFYRYALSRLHALLPPARVALYATNNRLANVLSTVFDHPCREGCLATLYLPVDRPGQARSDPHPHVHIRFAGEWRPEKGGELLPDIVRGYAEARAHRSFAVQVTSREMAVYLEARLRGVDAQLVVTHGQLSQEEHQNRLLRSDILLLPYNAQRYTLRASGIFSEAMGLGLVTVVPAETWMADMLAAGWGAGATFAHFSAMAVVGALLAASDRLPTMAPAAARTRKAWRRTHSAEALLDHVLTGFGTA